VDYFVRNNFLIVIGPDSKYVTCIIQCTITNAEKCKYLLLFFLVFTVTSADPHLKFQTTCAGDGRGRKEERYEDITENFAVDNCMQQHFLKKMCNSQKWIAA
jgi:hypothetical protein